MRSALSLKFLPILVLLAVSACKAEKVEIKITPDDIISAADGKPVMVEFETTVGEKYTKIDDEKRSTIKSVETMIVKYFPDAEVEVEFGSDEYSITITGEIAVANAEPKEGAPWYVTATKITPEGGIFVSLQPSSSFDAFDAELQGINLMLGPDKFQPVTFKVKGDKGRITAGGVYVDGVPSTLAFIDLKGERVSLLFDEGVWTKTAGGFLFDLTH